MPLTRPLTLISRLLPTVRVDREIDLRRFPFLPRATQKSEQMYKGLSWFTVKWNFVRLA